MTAPWCGQPLPDDRDGWKTRAMAFKESAEEAEAEVKRLQGQLQIARAALEELARIEGPGGWTENMAARVALHKLDGRL